MSNTYTWNPFENSDESENPDIELLKTEVGKHFPFYDLRFSKDTTAFFVRIEEETLEKKFDLLRRALSEKGFIPILKYEQGEHIIYVVKKPKRKEKPVWVNYLLLIATIITTIITGSILYLGFSDVWTMPNPMDVLNPINLFYGALLFSLPLMSILIIHEMGHYYISKKHGIATSLPFFLPIPPVLPSLNIGTFGALISSRDPMPNKKALFDVGIAGPIAGFLVAIPITAIGIATAEKIPIPTAETLATGEAVFGSSILIELLTRGILNLPQGMTIDMNPVLFAGWVGLLITSINLLPAGQLDGGHIFRAVLGEKQKYAGWIAIFIMIFTGWFFFAIVILFLMGMMHPPPLNDDTELDIKRKLLFIVALVVLIICFIPFPIYVK
ncbi:MAG: site-2 protease family protein [Thermoplasmatales archaeon]|nr:MAG: site-2 protease family protein [Thermoplasmatales archaeon]